MNLILRYFLRNELIEAIPKDDVVGKNRFVLFRIFTLSGTFVCLGVALKMWLTIPEAGILPWFIIALAFTMLLNYFIVRTIKKLSRAYLIMLLAAFALLHLVAYTCGGIRTGGILYYSVIILYAFMLLGRKGGLYFTLLFAANVIYFYFISTFTEWTSFAMFKNEIGLINEDFLINALFTFYLVYSQGTYLQSGKNIVIQTLEQSKREIEIKASQLEENNNLLAEYTRNLEKSNRELDKFASVASHDLKAPLRAIGIMSDFIAMELEEYMNDQIKTNLSVIKNRVERMDLLLDALLKYSRADRKELQAITIDTEMLIDEIIQNLSYPRHYKFKIKSILPIIETDAEVLKSIFEIIIDNALRFNDKEIAEIELRAEENENDWTFFISDNGPGIEKQFQDKIFVIFQTLNARDVFESTGAGLAIGKKIIENNGGRIGVNSILGQGSEFYFSIPKVMKKCRPILTMKPAKVF